MSTVLRLAFPGRRYHSTPWGVHVNEGQVEWPPSPWRILRALLSTGFTKLHWEPTGPPPVAQRLIQRLASTTPKFVLPPIVLAHSRHYVDAGPKKSLIFDTWAQVDDGIVEVVWDVDLPQDELDVMNALTHALGYLGRAESWVTGSVAERPKGKINCMPDATGPPGPMWEPVGVQCTMTPEAYEKWRKTQVKPIIQSYTPEAGKKMTVANQRRLNRELAPYPEDLISALCMETAEIHTNGWSTAPGSRQIIYWRRADAMTPKTSTRWAQATAPPVPFGLLALSTPSRNTSALPPLSRVFPQGRLLHRAIASVVGKQMGGDSDLLLCLLGYENNQPAQHNHQHAHILHLDLCNTGRLDHVLVYAPMGLNDMAQEVLRRLRRTYMKGGAGELQVALAAIGDESALRSMTPPVGDSLTRVLGPKEGALVWHSATPYVAPRLLKKRGKDSLAGQVRLECERRGLPVPVKVTNVAFDPATPNPFRHYIMHDRNHQPPWPMNFALTLTFDQPVKGPLCLGYGSHAGLGRFEAAPEP